MIINHHLSSSSFIIIIYHHDNHDNHHHLSLSFIIVIIYHLDNHANQLSLEFSGQFLSSPPQAKRKYVCFLFHPVKSLGRVGRLSFFFSFFL